MTKARRNLGGWGCSREGLDGFGFGLAWTCAFGGSLGPNHCEIF